MGKASRYMPAVGTFGHKWYPEDIVGYPEMTIGNFWFVNSNKVDGNGKSWEKPFADLQTALDSVSSGDVIYMAPGTYTGNYTCPDDTEARNVSVIGVNPGQPGIRGGVNLSPTSSASPIITCKASGWRFSKLCLRPGATSSGIKLYADISTTDYIAGVAGGIAQGVTVDNCMFWGGGTGKYGIESLGVEGTNSPHFVNIINNDFMYLNATGAAAIYGADGSNPNIGWRVIGNKFESNRSHINCHAKDGWVGSRFEDNTFPYNGVYASALDGLVKVRATATPDITGGNVFANNFFGCNLTDYSASNDMIQTNGYDHGMGNWCDDGIPVADINHYT